MSEQEFEEQLRQEKLESEAVETGRIRRDSDGTVYEWDADKSAWFPKIDEDFIAQYQMNYGADVATTTTNDPDSTSVPPTTLAATNAPSVTDPSYYNYYYSQYARAGDTPTTTTDSAAYRQWYEYYYGAGAQQPNGKDKNDDTDKPDSSESAGIDPEEPKGSSEKDGEKGSKEADSSTGDIPPPPPDTNSKEYYTWYHKYYGNQTSETSESWAEYWQYYSQIGEDGMKNMAWTEGGTIVDSTAGSSQTAEGADKSKEQPDDGKGKGKGKRKPPEPPAWFEVDEKKNTNVYVTGLPPEMTDDEFRELMNKCGLIMFDPITRKPKLKLYKDNEGNNKGDGRCCYIKPESVDLALQFLDGSDVEGHKIYVERAKFEMKGNFDASKKRRKMTKHEKKKFQMKQEKLFDWRPDKPLGARNKNEKVVILRNVYDPKIFEKDPTLVATVRSNLQKECTVFGVVKKVVIYDRHQEGIASVTFTAPEEADICIEGMNGRYYCQRLVKAETWDGKAKYHVQETEDEYNKRLGEWDRYLEGTADQSSKSPGTSAIVTAQVSSSVIETSKNVVKSDPSGSRSPPKPTVLEGTSEPSSKECESVEMPQEPIHRGAEAVEAVSDNAPEREESLMNVEESRQEEAAPIPEGAAASGAETD